MREDDQHGTFQRDPADRKRLWDEDKGFNDAFGPGVLIVNKDGGFACWFMSLPDHCCC